MVNEIRNCTAQKIADENKPVPAAMVRERLLYWIISDKFKTLAAKTICFIQGFTDSLVKVRRGQILLNRISSARTNRNGFGAKFLLPISNIRWRLRRLSADNFS